ncbi:hypothetical protein DFQ26_006241 [Actinomortierella ambigua]|nr:hypothetical protein DFQ26_006241 [Actinomortierella ambigua]
MANQRAKVLIAGAGIGGLSLAIFLEKGGVDYVVLEGSPSVRVLGSGLSLSCQVLRVFDQVGILDDLMAVSKRLMGIHYFDKDLKRVGGVDTSGFEERYGYPSVFFARPDLADVLLKHVPAHKVQWGKKIVSSMQSSDGVTVHCADGSSYDGDILIGADGAYSAVRRSIYRNMEEKGSPVPKEDTEALRFDQFCILGVTKPIGDQYPILNKPTTNMEIILANKEIPYNQITAIPLTGSRLAWSIRGHFLEEQVQDAESFRFSEWGSETIDSLRKEIDSLKVSIGGTIGEMIEHSGTNLSRVMIEEKLFSVWFDGRIALMGDAAHKLNPSGGQGANQTILDAICLANLIHELPSTSTEDINQVFTKYFEIRYPTVKKAVEGSAKLSKIMVDQGWFSDIMRSVALNMPKFITEKIQDSMFGGRPILYYLDAIPCKGEVKSIYKPHSLKDNAVAL